MNWAPCKMSCCMWYLWLLKDENASIYICSTEGAAGREPSTWSVQSTRFYLIMRKCWLDREISESAASMLSVLILKVGGCLALFELACRVDTSDIPSSLSMLHSTLALISRADRRSVARREEKTSLAETVRNWTRLIENGLQPGTTWSSQPWTLLRRYWLLLRQPVHRKSLCNSKNYGKSSL